MINTLFRTTESENTDVLKPSISLFLLLFCISCSKAKKKKTYLSPLSNRKVRMFKEDFYSNIFTIHLKERTHQKKIITL